MKTNGLLTLLIMILVVFQMININGIGVLTSIYLEDSNGTFIGESEGDFSGYSISDVGDVNGDGFDDIIIGAYRNDHIFSGSGQTYLIFGKGFGWERGINLSEADASFFGEYLGDNSGYSVSGVGDVNNDGYDDILIGAIENDEGGLEAGQSYLILGKRTGWHQKTNLSASDASFIGENSGDRSGGCVSSAGDVNGDGYYDFLITSYRNDETGSDVGQTYLFFGKEDGWEMDTSVSDADVSFIGEKIGDRSGISASCAGDVNSDGYDDIIIGAYRNTEGGGDRTGQTYLILGKPDGWYYGISLSDSDASFIGEKELDYSGYSISGAGDVNGDDFDDILISSHRNSEGGVRNGQTYLIFGKEDDWEMDFNLSNSDASFIGENAVDYSGGSVSSAGDVNRDGYSDFLIGAHFADSESPDTGKTYLIFGKPSNWEQDVNLSSANVTFIGEKNNDYSGNSVSGAGDVNGDGFDDIIIGAYRNDKGGDDSGKTYLCFLRENEPPVLTKVVINNTNEDELFSIYYYATDYETPTKLSWEFHTNATWLAFNETTLELFGKPTNDNIGHYWINISIKDINGGIDWWNTTINVLNVNDPPYIINEDILSSNEDELYCVQYLALDIDPTNGVFIWNYSSNASWLEFDKYSGYLNGTPHNSDVGSYWVNISVSDGNDGVDWTNFTIVINNVNDPPLIQNEDKMIAIEDQEYYNQYTAIDHDPTIDDITWTYSSNADWLDFDELTQNVTGIPTNDNVDLFWVNITVSDNHEGMSFRNFTLKVLNTNDPPEITHEEIRNALEDETFSYEYTVVDIDPTGDLLTSAFRSNAGWLSFDETSWTISGVPGNGDAGIYWVNLTVLDDKGGISYSNISITVIGVNTAPEWGTFETLYEGKKGEPISIQVVATDYDIEDEIIYSLNGALDGIIIDPETGLITWEDPVKGNYILNVSATDGNVTIYTSISLKITDDPDNGKITLSMMLMAISVICIIVLLLMAFLYLKKKDVDSVPEE